MYRKMFIFTNKNNNDLRMNEKRNVKCNNDFLWFRQLKLAFTQMMKKNPGIEYGNYHD